MNIWTDRYQECELSGLATSTTTKNKKRRDLQYVRQEYNELELDFRLHILGKNIGDDLLIKRGKNIMMTKLIFMITI